MMLRDLLRYPGVFKKSVRGKMCLFFRYLKLCPRENFLKMAPQEFKFERILGKIDRMFENRF